jgi:hypothetical protein
VRIYCHNGGDNEHAQNQSVHSKKSNKRRQWLAKYCIMFHHMYFPLLSSFVRRSLELGANFPTTIKEASFFFGLVFFCLFFSLRSSVLDLCFVLFLFYFFDSHHMFV